MLIAAALLLILAVIAGVALVLFSDLRTRPQGERLGALREWQGLIGSVLGLFGAAGVFVLSTEIQADTARQRAIEVQQAIGAGLAIEAARVASVLATGRYQASTLTFDGVDDARECASFLRELKRYTPRETPVYQAVLGRLEEFGSQNLSWFVFYHAVYADILRALEEADDVRTCTDATAETDVLYVAGLIDGAITFYQRIAEVYGTSPIASDEQYEAILSGQPESQSPSSPATPAN